MIAGGGAVLIDVSFHATTARQTWRQHEVDGCVAPIGSGSRAIWPDSIIGRVMSVRYAG
jgi:hypothetical protein